MTTRIVHIAALLMLLSLVAACGQPADEPAGSAGPSPDSATTENAREADSSPVMPQASPTVAISSDTTGSTEDEIVPVVATTSIIADLVQNVGGERVSVRSLLPPGADPHTYSPTPRDVQAVADSQILFQNGLGLEDWLDEVISNAGGERAVVTVTEGITPIEGDQHADEHGDEHAEEEATAADNNHGDEHSEDPHMWFDVQRVIRYVENIRDGLKDVDPDNADLYDANATDYIEQLEQLDQEIVEQVETIPSERRKMITNHDTFRYFAERYGFEIVGTVFEGVSTEQEPSAQQIASLVQQIEAQNVSAVFTENTVNPRLAEQIADEAGVVVVTNLYTDALGEPGSEADTYINMMRHNVQQIVEALR